MLRAMLFLGGGEADGLIEVGHNMSYYTLVMHRLIGISIFEGIGIGIGSVKMLEIPDLIPIILE